MSCTGCKHVSTTEEGAVLCRRYPMPTIVDGDGCGEFEEKVVDAETSED